MRYSESFREKMVEKMAGPSRQSAMSLSREAGVSQGTLSRWLREAGRVTPVASRTKKKRQQRGGSAAPKRPQDWTPTQKFEVVMEAAALSDEELGEFLRKKGLHEAQLIEWRAQLEKAAPDAFGGQRRSRKPSPEKVRIRDLEKDLRRKERALAETSALLVLKKKPMRFGGSWTTTRTGRATVDHHVDRRSMQGGCTGHSSLRNCWHHHTHIAALASARGRRRHALWAQGRTRKQAL